MPSGTLKIINKYIHIYETNFININLSKNRLIDF